MRMAREERATGVLAGFELVELSETDAGCPGVRASIRARLKGTEIPALSMDLIHDPPQYDECLWSWRVNGDVPRVVVTRCMY